MYKKTHLILLASLIASAKASVTPGWENTNSGRKEFPSAEILWSAPNDGRTVQRENGALGAVTVADGVVKVLKTNDLGRIVVTDRLTLTLTAGETCWFTLSREFASTDPCADRL